MTRDSGSPKQLPNHGPWKVVAEMDLDDRGWARLSVATGAFTVVEAGATKVRLALRPTMLSGARMVQIVQGRRSLGRRPGNFRAEMGEAEGLIRATNANQKPRWIYGRQRRWTILIWVILLGLLAARLVWITSQ
jgi:hypothetical protein